MHRLVPLVLLAALCACTSPTDLRQELSDEHLTVHVVERGRLPGTFDTYGLRPDGQPCEGHAVRMGPYTDEQVRCGGAIERRCLPTDPAGCGLMAERLLHEDRRASADAYERGCIWGGRCQGNQRWYGWQFRGQLAMVGCARGNAEECLIHAQAAHRDERVEDAIRAGRMSCRLTSPERCLAFSAYVAEATREAMRTDACAADPSLEGCSPTVN
jgi:hypothetical protein